MKNMTQALLILVLFVTSSTVHGEQMLDQEPVSKYYPEYQLKHFEEDPQGYLSNLGTDSYLIIPDLDLARDQLCNLQLSLDFKEPLFRPALFEVFWAAKGDGFKENQKAAFLINQADTAQANTFIVPLCKLHNFSGNLNVPNYQANINRLRLDYPSNKTISIKIEKIGFLSNPQASKLSEQNDAIIKLEAYERIVGKSFTSLDVIIPKLIFAFEQGLTRLTEDKFFLVFWLLFIFGLIILFVRSFRRS